MYKNEILNAIDDINLITSECEYDTINEMYNSYNKASMILENYDGDKLDAFNVFNDTNEFYQESVSDKMKQSGAKYGTLMKIITFIPRLIKALFQTIIEKFKKVDKNKTKIDTSNIKKAPKEIKQKLAEAFDFSNPKKKRIAILSSIIGGTALVGGGMILKVHINRNSKKNSTDNDNKKDDKQKKNENNKSDYNNSIQNNSLSDTEGKSNKSHSQSTPPPPSSHVNLEKIIENHNDEDSVIFCYIDKDGNIRELNEDETNGSSPYTYENKWANSYFIHKTTKDSVNGNNIFDVYYDKGSVNTNEHRNIAVASSIDELMEIISEKQEYLKRIAKEYKNNKTNSDSSSQLVEKITNQIDVIDKNINTIESNINRVLKQNKIGLSNDKTNNDNNISQSIVKFDEHTGKYLLEISSIRSMFILMRSYVTEMCDAYSMIINDKNDENISKMIKGDYYQSPLSHNRDDIYDIYKHKEYACVAEYIQKLKKEQSSTNNLLDKYDNLVKEFNTMNITLSPNTEKYFKRMSDAITDIRSMIENSIISLITVINEMHSITDAIIL